MAGHLGHSFTGVIRLNRINFLTPLGGRGGAVCFTSDATPEKKKKKMEEEEEQHADSDNTHRGDAMSHSFGDGYSTRSDWEGFGGIYARNPSDITHPEYDETHGSAVKEKEKDPNQPHEDES
ncbi:hypothetical protein B296_00027292 [Ensete ventricosum]|uniref:Uncharacterized protein n=1 Tax=Ensete ventricosum TaxID=4639 RepID=A0A426YC75_ENSVE|nr:hypothetical protein B296_00027292 [Ensete ventricosum]